MVRFIYITLAKRSLIVDVFIYNNAVNYKSLHFNEIDSTNTYLKNNYLSLDNFTFVSSDYQSNGKGRNDRKWLSDSGENLMFSFLIKNPSLINIAPLLSMMTACEVAKLLEELDIKEVSIKWTKDVLVSDKKICGILLEGQMPNYVVVGVGLNVNQKVFPPDLRRPATSISSELNEEIAISSIKEKLFSNIVNNFTNMDEVQYLLYLNKHNYLADKKVCVNINQQDIVGRVVGIGANFNLLIQTDDDLLRVNSGEIEIL